MTKAEWQAVNAEAAERKNGGKSVTGKSIIFTGNSPTAILAGRKPLTRRIIKPQPFCPGGKFLRHIDGAWWWSPGYQNEQDGRGSIYKPPYAPGDILWVKEPWRIEQKYDSLKPSELPRDAQIEYLADGKNYLLCRYRNARFMCRWMSRIDLRVLDVRPERLQDITEGDIQAEGIGYEDIYPPVPALLRTCFEQRWDDIHGRYSWSKNPWVWRIEFERRKL